MLIASGFHISFQIHRKDEKTDENSDRNQPVTKQLVFCSIDSVNFNNIDAVQNS